MASCERCSGQDVARYDVQHGPPTTRRLRVTVACTLRLARDWCFRDLADRGLELCTWVARISPVSEYLYLRPYLLGRRVLQSRHAGEQGHCGNLCFGS